MPIVIHIKRLYKTNYLIGNKLSKRDKLGIHSKIENIILIILADAIEAILKPRHEKITNLQKLRCNIEILKHLIRLENELKIIPKKNYLSIIQILEDISMMANGWIKSLNQKSSST